MANKKIWFIDENENQSRTYTRQLRRIMPDTISVKALFPPFHQKHEYLSVLDDPETVCIIIDQKLKDTGIATYTGIELALYLRAIDSKLPIYILTNFADLRDEYASGEWSVEDVIPKDVFNDEFNVSILKARILRRIDVHEDLLMDRSKRLNQLLKKRLNQALSETEEVEFQELQFERFAPIEAGEALEKFALDKVMEANRKLIDVLSHITTSGVTKDG